LLVKAKQNNLKKPAIKISGYLNFYQGYRLNLIDFFYYYCWFITCMQFIIVAYHTSRLFRVISDANRDDIVTRATGTCGQESNNRGVFL